MVLWYYARSSTESSREQQMRQASQHEDVQKVSSEQAFFLHITPRTAVQKRGGGGACARAVCGVRRACQRWSRVPEECHRRRTSLRPFPPPSPPHRLPLLPPPFQVSHALSTDASHSTTPHTVTQELQYNSLIH